MRAALVGWRALQGDPRNFSRRGLGRLGGSAACAFLSAPPPPREVSLLGQLGYPNEGNHSAAREAPQRAGWGAEKIGDLYRGRGCTRTWWRSKSLRRVWERPEVKGSWKCKGVQPCPSDSCEGSRGQVCGLRGKSVGPDHRQGRRSRGHKAPTLGVSCRTCRRGWGPSSQPAMAARYGTWRGHCG